MKKELFNDNWLYWPEENAFALMWSTSDSAKKITLPHDAMIYEAPNKDSVAAGNTGYRDGNVYYYSKLFTPDESMKEKSLMLYFDGVYCNSQVYVNSELVTSHCNGYSGFYAKLNDYLNWGQENEIRVIVRNSAMPNSRWYSGGGIYRDVYLLIGGEIYVRPDNTRVITESIDDGIAVIKITGSVVNRKNNRGEIKVVFAVKNGNGEIVGTSEYPMTLFEGKEQEIMGRMAIENANLWTDETPYLYSLVTSIFDGDNLIDQEELTFGVRTITVDAKRGLRVNGKSVKLAGACIHHDNGLIGAATYYDFHYRQITKLKECGYNAIRMSHHPAATALLRVCDELGMYVMDETFDMWTRCKTSNDYAIVFEQNWEADVEAMVRKDFNHPSVILYSIGNEIPEIGTGKGSIVAKAISEKIRSLDTTRFTLASINGMFAIGHVFGEIIGDVLARHKEDAVEVSSDANVNEFMSAFTHMDEILRHDKTSEVLSRAGAATDILGYNYMTQRYEEDVKTYPNRVIVGSETNPPDISGNWKHVKKHPAIIGDFVWTGWDYIGESGVGIAGYEEQAAGFGTPYPCITAYTGQYDITGYLKPAGYFSAVVFGARKDPYICVQHPEHFKDTVYKTPWSLTDCLETWTYPGFEGKPINVEVYSAGDEVELLVNGKSVGKKAAGEEVGHIARFEAVYEPGEITAVTYEAGKEIGRFSLYTAKDASLQVNIHPGKTGKLVYIDVENRDENGVLDYNGAIAVDVKDVSNAEIFVGSANPFNEESYADANTLTYNGRAQIVAVKEKVDEPASININGIIYAI